MTDLMRDCICIVEACTSESGYADANEILAGLRGLCDKYGIEVVPDRKRKHKENR
jgi:4-aminobutyrate aminotransferase-like enzyme